MNQKGRNQDVKEKLSPTERAGMRRQKGRAKRSHNRFELKGRMQEVPPTKQFNGICLVSSEMSRKWNAPCNNSNTT